MQIFISSVNKLCNFNLFYNWRGRLAYVSLPSAYFFFMKEKPYTNPKSGNTLNDTLSLMKKFHKWANFLKC